MTPAELAAAIADLLRTAIAEGEIDLDAAAMPATVHLERPRQREHGDWATNIAMQLGKKAGMAPRAFAEIIAGRLQNIAGVKSVDIAGPALACLGRGGAGVSRGVWHVHRARLHGDAGRSGVVVLLTPAIF